MANSEELVLLLIVAWLLRFIDANYPLWNATITMFLAPIAARLILNFV